MKLLNCHIVNFGCLSDRTYSFRDGLNVLYAENGSGKSTLAVFIKAMLYGLSATTKQSLTENERKHYTPWNGGKFGGSLCFKIKEREYRIERFFGTREKDDTFKLYNLATQKESSDYDAHIGATVFGVDADGFERSLYVSQRAPFLPPKNNTIRARLGSLLEASDDLGDFEDAYKLLDGARRSYLTTGNRGKIGDLEKEISAKGEELKAAEDAKVRAEALLADAEALQKEKDVANESIARARENREKADKRRLLEEMGASYRRLTDAIEAEKRTLLPLNAFFEKHLPTERELAEAELFLQRVEAREAQRDLCHLSSEEADRLGDLRARYGESAPKHEATRMRDALTAYREALALEEKTAERADPEYDALRLHFADKEPSPEDIDALHKATADYDNAEATLLTEEEIHAKAAPPRSVITLGVLAATSLIASVLGFALSLPALGIPFAAVFAVFAVLFVLRRRALTQESRKAKEALQNAHAALSSLLLPYHYTEKNPSVGAKLLFKDHARYRALCAERQAQKQQHKEALAQKSTASATLDALLAKYRLADTYEKALVKLEDELSAHTHLSDAERTHKEKRDALTALIDEDQKKIDDFLSPFDELCALPSREALALLRERLLLSKESLSRYESASEKLKTFLSEADFDPTLPLPPYLGESEDFVNEERRLSQLLLSLETQISAKRTEAQYKNEAAEEIPSLLAQIDALQKEKAEAEHTYALLDTTRNILSEAKETLSTRYLSGIEHHFAEYLSLLNTKNEIYHFDTDLSVTTERCGERKTTEVLSRGEQDLIAFCARMSLIDAIFTEEPPFLVLDDPFVNLDDGNYARAFALLKELASRFQIFYTVCSKSRLTNQE